MPVVGTEPDDEAVDSRGIAGWDVDQLARALIDPSGLAVTNSQAREIKRLYDALSPYDKKSLEFQPVSKKASRGRFGRTKGGHVGLDQMKR